MSLATEVSSFPTPSLPNHAGSHTEEADRPEPRKLGPLAEMQRPESSGVISKIVPGIEEAREMEELSL